MTSFVKGTRDSDRDWDIAWIELSAPVGYTSGWKGIRTADYSSGTIINVAGYGGDCPAGGDCSDNMKTMACPIQPDPSCVSSSSHPNRYYYECDTIGGMSGSGAYLYYPSAVAPDNRFVIGVHAYGFDCSGLNRAIRIRPSILETMCANTPDMLCYTDSSGGLEPTCT
jgi:V8-like Glu-specific endopeptidase